MAENESATPKSGIGRIVWQDLTVPDAAAVKEFYSAVVGWEAKVHQEENCRDFDIQPPGSEDVVAGICYAEGSNAKLPPQWLIYIEVADADASAAVCVSLGGKVIDGPRAMGSHRFCVIQDPAGAVAALMSASQVEADAQRQ